MVQTAKRRRGKGQAGSRGGGGVPGKEVEERAEEGGGGHTGWLAFLPIRDIMVT